MQELVAVPDAALLTALAAVILVSAALQTATGFGFAILSAPIGAALVGGPEVVTTVLITGTAVDLLILGLRRSRPRPRWDEVGILGLASVPGLAVGAGLLAVLPPRALLVGIAAAVVLAVVLRALALRNASRREDAGLAAASPASRRWGWVAGAVSGTLATSTTLAGPPVVLYLGARRHPPTVTRDTLVTLNLVRLPISVAALAVGGVLVVVPGIAWLVLAALAGHGLGAMVFARLDVRRHENLVLGLLVLAAVTATVTALAR